MAVPPAVRCPHNAAGKLIGIAAGPSRLELGGIGAGEGKTACREIPCCRQRESEIRKITHRQHPLAAALATLSAPDAKIHLLKPRQCRLGVGRPTIVGRIARQSRLTTSTPRLVNSFKPAPIESLLERTDDLAIGESQSLHRRESPVPRSAAQFSSFSGAGLP